MIWIYNPHCDAEIARGRPGHTPTRGARMISTDLETVPIFLAQPTDAVLVQERPRLEWLESLKSAGIETPEIVVQNSKSLNETKTGKIGGLQPWGWSPGSFEFFKPLTDRLVDIAGGNAPWCRGFLGQPNYESTGLGKLFSKAWSVEFLREWQGRNPGSSFNSASAGSIFTDFESACARIRDIVSSGESAMVKAPYGTAGMQVRQVRTADELDGPLASPLSGWIKRTIERQGRIIVENFLNKTYDISVQIEISNDRIHLFEARRFITGSRHEYRGTYLGWHGAGFDPEHLKFLHTVLPLWQQFIRALGANLRDHGYLGPAGIDALIWRNIDGALQLKPLVELNPRWTMGRVAIELEETLAPGISGAWLFVPKSSEPAARKLSEKYPLQLNAQSGGPSNDVRRIQQGVIFTNDPDKAREVLTVLIAVPRDYLSQAIASCFC